MRPALEKQLQEIAGQLKRSKQVDAVVQILELRRKELNEAFPNYGPDFAVRQAQGRAAELDDLLKLFK